MESDLQRVPACKAPVVSLAKVLSDNDLRICREARESLLSFSAKDPGVAEAPRSNPGKIEFEPLPLNTLAKENPARLNRVPAKSPR